MTGILRFNKIEIDLSYIIEQLWDNTSISQRPDEKEFLDKEKFAKSRYNEASRVEYYFLGKGIYVFINFTHY